MTIFGYARGSTDGQSVGAQVAQLRAAGCAEIYFEKASGAKSNRTELTKALRKFEPGDVLVVTRLDRLARSTWDLLNTLRTLAERNVGFKSIGDAWADTTTPHGRLMLTVLGGLAEFERELIKARIARAKASGVRLGRPRKLNHRQRKKALARLAAGDTQADVARTYNVDASTIGRLA
jgi:DNA invertase Pin-like site-specific DNA recombinase